MGHDLKPANISLLVFRSCVRTRPDIRDLPEPLEIPQVLIPAITERNCEQLDTDSAYSPPGWFVPWKSKPGSKSGVRFISQSANAPPLI